MKLPYIRLYQQSTGFLPPNENHCPHGKEWEWPARWGKKPGVKFWGMMGISVVPIGIFLGFYGKYSWKREKYEEYMRIRTYLISSSASREELEKYEEMYRGFTTEEEVSVWNRLLSTFSDKGYAMDLFTHSTDYLKYFFDDAEKPK